MCDVSSCTIKFTHEIKTYFHHGAQACPMVEEGNDISNLHNAWRCQLANQDTIDCFVGVFGGVEEDLGIRDVRQRIRHHAQYQALRKCSFPLTASKETCAIGQGNKNGQPQFSMILATNNRTKERVDDKIASGEKRQNGIK